MWVFVSVAALGRLSYAFSLFSPSYTFWIFMNNLPREKLIQIIQENSISITNNPQQCKAFLLDYCGEYRLEINVLMSALQEGIVKELCNISQGIPLESILAKLRQQLETNLGIREDIAQWAVESWALALGVISESDLSNTQRRSASHIPAGSQNNLLSSKQPKQNLPPPMASEQEKEQISSKLKLGTEKVEPKGTLTLIDELALQKLNPIFVHKLRTVTNVGITDDTNTLDTSPLVVYVYNNSVALENLETIITQAKYQFRGLSEPVNALSILREIKPNIIFVDFELPQNSYLICTQIRKQSCFRNTPIIILMEKGSLINSIRAKMVGATDILVKPVDKGQILAIVKKYLAST